MFRVLADPACEYDAKTPPADSDGAAVVTVVCRPVGLSEICFHFDVTTSAAGGWQTDGVRIAC